MKKKYPIAIILVLFGILIVSFLVNEKSFLEIQHPPKSEYPWLYFINNVYENSTLTSGLLKVLYDKASFLFIGGVIFLYSYEYYTKKKFFFLDWIYFVLLFTLKLIFQFYFLDWKAILEILEIPFILILYSYFFYYFFIFNVNIKFDLQTARDFFLNSYGKVFLFIFVLNLGIESLPFDELSIYSQKYGLHTAWKIICYRNLIFDILFFAFVWSYLAFISFFKNISFISSFLTLNQILKSNKRKIFFYGFLYYLYISLVTIIDFYFEIQKYKLLFLLPVYFILLERMYFLLSGELKNFIYQTSKKQNELNKNSKLKKARRRS